jgi:hypothetical protein
MTAEERWWPSFGADDQHGMLNHLTDATRLAALGLVREGRMKDLGRVLDEAVPVFPGRHFRQTLDARLTGPNGIALSPDERYLYVGNWDPERRIVMRYPVDASGAVGPGEVLSTGAYWPHLSDGDLEVQRAVEIDEYTDGHHQATVPHTLVLAPGLVIDKAYVGYWFSGRPPTGSGRTCRTCSAAAGPTPTPPRGARGLAGKPEAGRQANGAAPKA